MTGFSEFLNAIPAAATNPLAFAAYAVTLVAASVMSLRVVRNRALLRRLDSFPKNDRRKVVQAEMNVVIPDTISAEEWLKSRSHTYYFVGFLALVASVTVVSILAIMRESGDGGSRLRPDGTGPVFREPRIAGRSVDPCIESSMFPAQRNMQCIRSAKLTVAGAFCRAAGYSGAEDFESRQTGQYQNSYKLLRNVGENGRLVEAWIETDTGGSVFTRIDCRQ